MNKNMTFMKTFWAAFLAFIAANVALGILTFMMFLGLITMMGIIGESMTAVDKSSILKIDLEDGIRDSPAERPTKIGFSGFEIDKSSTIMQAVNAIERAADDDRITGIYLNITSMNINIANIEELRLAINKFKSYGKFVISYSDVYSQGSYYLSSVADRVYMNPQGNVSWKGLAAHVMFYKGLLDKLGVEPEIIRHGSFKAAVEPFMLDKMSPENRLQMTTYTNTVWGSLLHDISESRGIDSAVLSNYATELSLRSAEYALEYGFVDALAYEDQVMSILGKLSKGFESIEEAEAEVFGQSDIISLGIESSESLTVELPDSLTLDSESMAEEDPDVTYVAEDNTEREAVREDKTPSFITLSEYIASPKSNLYRVSRSKNKIAVIYADGDIIDGKSVDGSIGGATIAEKISKARKNKNVKGVVLRVNSPGGSALASEVIWREMENTRNEKPVIVSMGYMAASGGYYISCPADVILANKTTLTGSIGVFGLMFNMGNALKDKLGITVDVAKTNPSADFGSPFRRLTSHERDVIQYSVEQIYGTFIGHVADGRNLSIDYVDRIGQGRIWSGVSAMDIGLIDGYGGLKDAIELAADRAGVPYDYNVWEVVDSPDNLSMILKTLLAGEQSKSLGQLGDAFAQYNALMNILSQEGTVQARMPYVVEIK